MTYALSLCSLFSEFPKKENNKKNLLLSNSQSKESFNFSYYWCLQRGLNPRRRPTNSATDPLGNSSFHHCCVSQLRAQLFTYHHLQPSLQSFVLSQEAPGISAASLRISYSIVPVLPTGTRGSLPSMEDTGIHTRLALIHGARIRW